MSWKVRPAVGRLVDVAAARAHRLRPARSAARRAAGPRRPGSRRRSRVPRIDGDARDEALRQPLRLHLVPAARGPGLRLLLAADVRREPGEELGLVADRVAAAAVAGVDVLAATPIAETWFSTSVLALAEVEDVLPVGVERRSPARSSPARPSSRRSRGRRSAGAWGSSGPSRAARRSEGLSRNGSMSRPRLAAVVGDADAPPRVLLVDDVAVVGVDRGEDPVAAVDLDLVAVPARSRSRRCPGGRRRRCRPWPSATPYGSSVWKPSWAPLPEALAGEVAAGADVLRVVAAVVAGEQRHAALAVGDEDPGVLVGVGGGVVGVRRPGRWEQAVGREHEQAGAAVGVVGTDRLERRTGRSAAAGAGSRTAPRGRRRAGSGTPFPSAGSDRAGSIRRTRTGCPGRSRAASSCASAEPLVGSSIWLSSPSASRCLPKSLET